MPTTDELVNLYEQRGGRLKGKGNFGWDPLSDDFQLVQERQRRIERNFPSYQQCFSAAILDNPLPLQQTILGCIRTTFDIVNTLQAYTLVYLS